MMIVFLYMKNKWLAFWSSWDIRTAIYTSFKLLKHLEFNKIHVNSIQFKWIFFNWVCTWKQLLIKVSAIRRGSMKGYAVWIRIVRFFYFPWANFFATSFLSRQSFLSRHGARGKSEATFRTQAAVVYNKFFFFIMV